MAGPQPYRQKGGGAEVPCQLDRAQITHGKHFSDHNPCHSRGAYHDYDFARQAHRRPWKAQICVDGNDATRKRSVVHQPYRIASRTTGTCDCGPARADPQPGASTYGHTCSAPLLCLVQVQVLAIIVPRSTTSWEAILTPLWWSIAPNRLFSRLRRSVGRRFGLESRAVGLFFLPKVVVFGVRRAWHY